MKREYIVGFTVSGSVFYADFHRNFVTSAVNAHLFKKAYAMQLKTKFENELKNYKDAKVFTIAIPIPQ
jgi:hypothetical protein